MFDDLAVRMAKLIVQYSVRVQSGESVMIEGTTEALPLINEIYREVMRAGGHPQTQIVVPGQRYIFFQEAKEHQLNYVNPFNLFIVRNVDVFLRIYSDNNIYELNNVDPDKIQISTMANAEMMRIFYQRDSQNSLKWCVLPWVTPGKAQAARMSEAEFAQIIKKSCFLDQEDPAAAWKALGVKQQRIIQFLSTINDLHVVAPQTDLTLSVKGRKWINCFGDKDLPDGEVYTAPREDSVNGTIAFSYPSRRVEGIRLRFEQGKVVDFSAEKGHDYLARMLQIPGADHLGEIGIGTNYAHQQYVNDILFDEKMGGTIHLALGAAYPDSGGLNESSLHWDILQDMRQGKMVADGRLFYENGQFLI